ncbi:MAG: DNA polymerase III subunit alpha [Flavobacteriales bacterium]
MLNNHSYFSLRFGTIEPKELLLLAKEKGHDCIALTDINCTAGVIDFCRLAPRHNIKPVVGVDFRNGAQQHYVAIAKNIEGFREINEHLSHHQHNEIPFEKRAPEFENCFVVYPLEQLNIERLNIKRLKDEGSNLQSFNLSIFNFQLSKNEFIGIHPRDLGKLRFSEWKDFPEKLVVLNTATFRNKRDFNAHRLLRAIDNNTLLSKLPKSEEGNPNDVMLSADDLEKAFEEFPHIIENTKRLLAQCEIDFEFEAKEHKNQLNYGSSAEEDNVLLEKLCAEGLKYRYPYADEIVQARLKKELEVIRQQQFVSYFLINWDIVNYARSKNYFYVGRGSGANSIVAYLLRITDVDPLELDLYFERFINLFRKNPPDFDIDFSWMDRDDVTRYIFERFENVALQGAFNTFQYSAVVRELAKVFGLPKSDIDMLSDGKFQESQLDSMHKLVLQYASYLHDFPNYISVHSCGILITEKPIHYYGATFMPPKGFRTTHFDMHQAEDIHINKLDILSQRGLAKIKDAIDIIKQNTGDEVDIHDVARFKRDKECNRLLSEATAIGCFYVESPAMRMLLKKLQTHSYLGLVAASSVIRPGVASSGMMRAYIMRERIPEKRSDAPKPLLDLMPDTYGVMVYQEDVIKVAHEFAGLDLGEADVLRRGMSGKFRGREEFAKAQEKFISGAIANGHSNALVLDVWRQVESFAGYAFAKGHSASYAVESYQCLFLKAYYPLEYMVACINNYGGFYRTEIYVHEARMFGAEIHAPCVNTSNHGAVIHGKIITLGLEMIKELEHGTRERILAARERSGTFNTLDEFLSRVEISLEQSLLLARIGALRFTSLSKKEMMWQLHFRYGKTKMTKTEQRLFETAKPNATLPKLEHHWLEDAYDELELIGFPLCNPFDLASPPAPLQKERGEASSALWSESSSDPSPVEKDASDSSSKQVRFDESEISVPNEFVPAPTLLKGKGEMREIVAKDFPKYIGKEITTVGYLTTLKPTRTSKGESMYFGTFLDREGQFIDTVHFPEAAKMYRVSGWGLFLLRGKVTEEFDAINIEVNYVERLKLMGDPRLEDTPSHPALMRKNNGGDRWINRLSEHENP